jgi:predicted Zn-dependent peptidase
MKLIASKTHSQMATIAVAFQAGSCLEVQKGFPFGTAHFLEHFMFKGTPKRTSFDISREVAFYGGDMNAYTSHEEVVYYISIPYESFDKAAEILSDMIFNPLFPENEMEKERQVILEEYASKFESINGPLMQKLCQEFFSNYQQYPVIGTEESIKQISLDDLKRFYSSFYKTENMLISVSSPGKKSDVSSVIEKYFGTADDQCNFILSPEKTKLHKNKRVSVFRSELEQAHVYTVWNSPKTGTKDSIIASVMGVILGDGMDSRLFQEVREKNNLVYGISASHHPDRTSGGFYISFQTRKNNLEKAEQIISSEVAKMTTELVTEEELQRAKNKLKTSIYQSFTYPQGTALRKIDYYMMSKKIPTTSQLKNKVESVTREDVMRVAAKIFSGKKLVAIGQKED